MLPDPLVREMVVPSMVPACWLMLPDPLARTVVVPVAIPRLPLRVMLAPLAVVCSSTVLAVRLLFVVMLPVPEIWIDLRAPVAVDETVTPAVCVSRRKTFDDAAPLNETVEADVVIACALVPISPLVVVMARL